MDTPSQKLADNIVNRLVSEKLLTSDAGSKLLQKLAAGKLRAEDWRLPFELVEVKKEAK